VLNWFKSTSAASSSPHRRRHQGRAGVILDAIKRCCRAARSARSSRRAAGVRDGRRHLRRRRSAVVGERGPELVQLPGGTRITPLLASSSGIAPALGGAREPADHVARVARPTHDRDRSRRGHGRPQGAPMTCSRLRALDVRRPEALAHRPLLGPEPVRVTAASAAGKSRARPRQVGMTTWAGVEPLQVELSLMFDGWAAAFAGDTEAATAARRRARRRRVTARRAPSRACRCPPTSG
jgi:hypothetical protein